MIDILGYKIRVIEGKNRDYAKGKYIEIEKNGKHIYDLHFNKVKNVYPIKEINLEEVKNGGIVGSFVKVVYLIKEILSIYGQNNVEDILRKSGISEEKINEFLEKEKEYKTLEELASKENLIEEVENADLNVNLKNYMQFLISEDIGEKAIRSIINKRLKEYREVKEKAKNVVEEIESETGKEIEETLDELEKMLIDVEIKYPKNGIKAKYKGENYPVYFNKENPEDLRMVIESDGEVLTKRLYKVGEKICAEKKVETLDKKEFLNKYEPVTTIEIAYFEYLPKKKPKKKIRIKRKKKEKTAIMKENYAIVKKAINEGWGEEKLRLELKDLTNSGKIMLINAYRKAMSYAPIKMVKKKKKLRNA